MKFSFHFRAKVSSTLVKGTIKKEYYKIYLAIIFLAASIIVSIPFMVSSSVSCTL